jgi:head-tail adaptor
LKRNGYFERCEHTQPEAVMSDEDDWDFAGAEDAKVTIRAAVRYLLKDTTDGVRGDIVQEIISIVRQVANGPPTSQPNPLDDDMPGG